MAWASVNQTWPHCVNQMGKTQSKPLAARHGRGTAWARHGHGMLCVNRPLGAFLVWTASSFQVSEVQKLNSFVWHVRRIANSDYLLHHVCLSVRIDQHGSHWTDFHEIWCLSIFRKYTEEIQVSLKSDKNNCTVHDGLCTFVTISRWILTRMINTVCPTRYRTRHFFNNSNTN